MQRVNEFSFYELAENVHPLTELQTPTKLAGVWIVLWQAREAIEIIFSLRPLSVCANAASALKSAITAAVPEGWEDLTSALAAETDSSIPPWVVHAIQRAAKDFETVLAAECQVLDTYFVSKKGTYSTADLIEHAHHHIPLYFRDKLPEQTKCDIDQAGKCLAFDLPTAAAFHLLRGSEAVLRQYYELPVPGNNKASPKMRNWGAYIKRLEDHGAEKKVTSLLAHLKDAYRNPVLHPEENYTDDRAQVLFGVCVSAIVMMVEEIEKHTPTSNLLPFTKEVVALPASITVD